MSFNNLEVTDLNEKLEGGEIKKPFVANVDELAMDDLFEPDNRFKTKLECIEDWASNNNMIDSEDVLNTRIHRYCVELMDLSTVVKMQSDRPMVSTFGSNLTDSWVRDGELHSDQFNSYDICLDFSAVASEIAQQESN